MCISYMYREKRIKGEIYIDTENANFTSRRWPCTQHAGKKEKKKTDVQEMRTCVKRTFKRKPFDDGFPIKVLK